MAASENVHETEKSQKLLIRDFNSSKKNQDSSTSVFETSAKCISLCFYFIIGCPWNLKLNKYFFDVVRNKPQTKNIYARVDTKKIKSKYIIRTCYNML